MLTVTSLQQYCGSGFHFPLFSLMLLFFCFYLEIVKHVDSKSRQIISKTLSLTVLVEVFIAVKRDYDHSNSYNGKHFAGLQFKALYGGKHGGT